MERVTAGASCPSLNTSLDTSLDSGPKTARGWLRALRSIGKCYYAASQVAVRIHYDAPWLADCANRPDPAGHKG